MRVIIKPRQTGKTTELVMISAEKKLPIICKNKIHKESIINLARRINVEIPDPISLSSESSDVIRNKLLLKGAPTEVLIDDAEFILEYLINKVYGCDVHTMAFVLRNEKGHELTADGEDLNEKYNL